MWLSVYGRVEYVRTIESSRDMSNRKFAARLARYRLIPHLTLTATIFHEYVPRLTEKHSHS